MNRRTNKITRRILYVGLLVRLIKYGLQSLEHHSLDHTGDDEDVNFDRLHPGCPSSDTCVEVHDDSQLCIVSEPDC